MTQFQRVYTARTRASRRRRSPQREIRRRIRAWGHPQEAKRRPPNKRRDYL